MRKRSDLVMPKLKGLDLRVLGEETFGVAFVSLVTEDAANLTDDCCRRRGLAIDSCFEGLASVTGEVCGRC